MSAGQEAIDALRAVQSAQDDYFGRHARYADEGQLRASSPQVLLEKALSEKGFPRAATIGSRLRRVTTT